MEAGVKRKVVSSVPPDSENPWSDAVPNTATRENMPPPPSPETKSKADTELIIAALTQTYAAVGQGVFIFVNHADGAMIVREAPDLAESWRNLLDNDPKLRKVFKGLIKGGGWGTVITAHLAVAMPIIANHEGALEHLVRRKRDTNSEQETDSPTY